MLLATLPLVCKPVHSHRIRATSTLYWRQTEFFIMVPDFELCNPQYLDALSDVGVKLAHCRLEGSDKSLLFYLPVS